MAHAGDGGAGAARARFEAALELAGRDEARAAEELVALADAEPDGEYAAEALSEAAGLFEERLDRPDRARDLYARLLARHPDSRPALRARARLEFLDANLRTGAAPLGEYQRILAGFAGRPPAESRRMMADLVARHPDFALADRALLWLGTLDARDGRFTDAQARFAEVERRFPDGETAALARKGRADALLAAGHPREARALYRSLLQPPSPWPAAREGAHAGEEACRRALRREQLFAAALALIALYLAALLWLARPLRPLRLGPELGYYLPVAALFVAAALTEARPIALATSAIAAGGAAITFSCSRAAERLTARRGRLGPLRTAALAAATFVAVVALAYAALHKAGLVDFTIETLRSGPDR